MEIILEHVLKVGGTDFSDEIRHMILRKKRATTEKPATAGNASPEMKAGARSYEVEIEFFTDVTSTTCWRKFWDAIDTATSELTFAGRYRDAAIGATNPEWSGTMIVLQSEIGGDPNTYPRSRFTFPVTAAGFAEDTTP